MPVEPGAAHFEDPRRYGTALTDGTVLTFQRRDGGPSTVTRLHPAGID